MSDLAVAPVKVLPAVFDNFWVSVFGADWYIVDHDDESGAIDNVPVDGSMIVLRRVLDVRWQHRAGAGVQAVESMRKRFPFLTEQEFTVGAVELGRVDGLVVLRRWLNVNFPEVSDGGTVSMDVPAAIAGDVRALIDAYYAKNGGG